MKPVQHSTKFSLSKTNYFILGLMYKSLLVVNSIKSWCLVLTPLEYRFTP